MRDLAGKIKARIDSLTFVLFEDDKEARYLPPAERIDVARLRSLTEHLQKTLVPVPPRAEFRSRLKESLIAAASQRMAAERESRVAALRRRWMLIGAAAGSLSMLSVAGIIAAVLLHQRTIRL